MPTTADVLTMSPTEYADHLATIDFGAAWPDHEEPDEFRNDRSQWAAEEDDHGDA